MKRVILTADDFGLSEAVNEGIERAHRDGMLTSASLMVAAPAANDALRRAKAMPSLKVGLHLVVIEGPAVLRPREIPNLMDVNGQFGSDQLRCGIGYFAHPRIRRQLAAEIRAQFEAFAATGLALDHADAHKHMQLHPTVGRLLIDIGKTYGLRALRIPAEPPAVLLACGTSPSFGNRALHAWSTLLRRQARHVGLVTNDHVFGLAWSGHMTEDRLLRLIPHLPDGLSEIYFHPATGRDPTLDTLMPSYEHTAELAALLSPALRCAIEEAGVMRTSFSDIARADL
jgi:hopanoid biosynthesis associated protein HpnK